MTAGKETGLGYVELMIASFILVVLLGGIMSTQRVVAGTLNVNDRKTDAVEALDNATHRMSRLLRPGALSTIRVRATQPDIDLAIADPEIIYIPTLGEWISPLVSMLRANLRFQTSIGNLAMIPSALSPLVTLEFLMDGSETDNGTDDDGDGMVDEGKLFASYGTDRWLLLDAVEVFEVTLDGNAVEIRLQCARADKSGGVHRETTTRRLKLRNT